MRDEVAAGTLLMSLTNGMRSKHASRVAPLVARNPVLIFRVRCLIEAGCESEGWLAIGVLHRQVTAILEAQAAQRAIEEALHGLF